MKRVRGLAFSPAQCRAARALLNWSTGDLADRAGVAERKISDFEENSGTLDSEDRIAILMTFRNDAFGGVVFIEAARAGEGVRLRAGLWGADV